MSREKRATHKDPTAAAAMGLVGDAFHAIDLQAKARLREAGGRVA